MDELLHDGYVVYVRDERATEYRPEAIEKLVATCPSYEEASRVAQQFRHNGRKCIIRSIGESGVGD